MCVCVSALCVFAAHACKYLCTCPNIWLAAQSSVSRQEAGPVVSERERPPVTADGEWAAVFWQLLPEDAVNPVVKIFFLGFFDTCTIRFFLKMSGCCVFPVLWCAETHLRVWQWRAHLLLCAASWSKSLQTFILTKHYSQGTSSGNVWLIRSTCVESVLYWTVPRGQLRLFHNIANACMGFLACSSSEHSQTSVISLMWNWEKIRKSNGWPVNRQRACFF